MPSSRSSLTPSRPGDLPECYSMQSMCTWTVETFSLVHWKMLAKIYKLDRGEGYSVIGVPGVEK